MRKRAFFLVSVAVILLVLVGLVGWLSTLVFGKLEPAFLGALVSASGTIFAGCVAYMAASQNLEMASRSAEQNALAKIENDKMMKQVQLTQAKTELHQVRDALAHIDQLLNKFEGASEGGLRDYVGFMHDILRSGGVVPYQAQLPQPLMGRMQERIIRLHNMQGEVTVILHAPADQMIGRRAAMNKALREHVTDMRKLRNDMDEEVRRRERDVDAMARTQE